MNIAIRISSLVLALAAILMPAATASAQPTADQVAERAIAGINNLSDRAQAQMTNTTDATISAIERLDAKGATNEQITRAGDRGKVRINHLKAQNTRQLSRRGEVAIRHLQRLNADQALIDQVSAASTGAVTALETKATESRAAIDAAVATATAG